VLFNSSIFLAFLLVLLPLYAVLRRVGARKALLLLASYAFYAHWDWRYLFLLAGSTVVDWLVSRALDGEQRPGPRRALLLASLTVNLGALAVFKYGNFLIGSLVPLGWLGADARPLLPVAIPVGISFYTFQTLSYTLDVHARRRPACRSLTDFALYVAFFPQLVAGPIVRSGELLPQLARLPALRMEDIAAGSQRFLLGLFKKVVVADNASLFVDAVFADPSRHGALTLWCGAYAFAVQIYCDFSGYTDMALGLGRAFGVKLPENFDAPYLARSVTEFWRRWHITLSTWLRDYLYIPLGGSQGPAWFTGRNLMLTMLLGGLWHGAAWTFVAWGGLHGLMLAVERLTGTRKRLAEEAEGRHGGLVGLFNLLVTFHMVCLAWVMFRADGFSAMGTYLGRMCFAWADAPPVPEEALVWAGVTAGLLGTQAVLRRARLKERVWERFTPLAQGISLALLVLAVAALRVDEVAFIYFQF
jgi:D-alanyl-lipoteichoic acid acyltransferase DltB (MBOAT superfamily)